MAGPGEDEGPQMFNGQVMYREWGRRFTVLQKYLKGIEYYEKSTEFGDENFIWTLLGLSEALKKSGQFQKAAEVAEKSLEIDPTHMRANYTRVEALYDIAEFGKSLMYAYQGVRQRPQFRPNILLANETIEDCIGKNVPRQVLRQIHPWIVALHVHREALFKRLQSEEDEFADLDADTSNFKVDDPAARLQRHRKLLDRYMASMYLGPTAVDKRFLEELLHHKALSSANKQGSIDMANETNECMKRIRSQQEALRFRRPLYALKAARELSVTEGVKVMRWQELQLKKCLTRNLAKHILRKLHNARLAMDYPLFFKLVEQAKERFDSWSLKVFPEKQRYLDAVYKMVCRAYLDPRNLMRFTVEQEELRQAYLRKLMGLKGGWMPREADLALPPNLNIKQSFKTCCKRLALAKRKSEILWLFHELCKLFLEIDRLDMARFYAKKTCQMAEGSFPEWVVNGNHVIMRIELAQHNRNEAKEAASTALKAAKKLNLEFLMDFYERALFFLDNVDFSSLQQKDGVESRQILISKLMPDNLRATIDMLFRSMEAVPARRRMSVMPGCKPKDKFENSNKQTIRPGPPVDLKTELTKALLKKFSPSKEILGYIDFSDYD